MYRLTTKLVLKPMTCLLPHSCIVVVSIMKGIMIAKGGNNRGIKGVIPQGPERSNVCLRVAKVTPDGETSTFVSALLEGMIP